MKISDFHSMNRSRTPQLSGMAILVSCLFVVIVGFIGVSLGYGDTTSVGISPEGFSSSSAGLAFENQDAWNATVLIESRAVIGSVGDGAATCQ